MQNRQHWVIFCKVIDNFGDIGVCWRLGCDLAARGVQVRLWVDDASTLAWMAPAGSPDVQVLAWTAEAPRLGVDTPGDVIVAAFGCEIAPEFIAACAHSNWSNSQLGSENVAKIPPAPVCINLEYLSAESFVERNHGLPSPVLHGPAQGMSTWFYYPGFTVRTGGLIRELGLVEQMAEFGATDWLEQQGLAQNLFTAKLSKPPQAATRISLFCYESQALPQLLDQLAESQTNTQLIVTAGRAQRSVVAALEDKNAQLAPWNMRKQLSISYLPSVNQKEYDHLLWACELNFVRGEDSLVRALWAGKPFVWHIYPQGDGAHATKLEAFLDWLDAPADLRDFHRVWNGLSHPNTPLPPIDLAGWGTCAQAARQRLLAQPDLCTQLLDFVEQKRRLASAPTSFYAG